MGPPHSVHSFKKHISSYWAYTDTFHKLNIYTIHNFRYMGILEKNAKI